MNAFVSAVILRLKEPSSWAAIAVLAGVFGVKVAPESIGNIIGIGAVIAGFLGVVLPEAKRE